MGRDSVSTSRKGLCRMSRLTFLWYMPGRCAPSNRHMSQQCWRIRQAVSPVPATWFPIIRVLDVPSSDVMTNLTASGLKPTVGIRLSGVPVPAQPLNGTACQRVVTVCWRMDRSLSVVIPGIFLFKASPWPSFSSGEVGPWMSMHAKSGGCLCLPCQLIRSFCAGAAVMRP